MLDVLDPLHLLHLRILEQNPRHEPAVKQDVDVLVDRRGDEESAVLLVVGRQVGSPAAERDPQWASGHDHVVFSGSALTCASYRIKLACAAASDSGLGRILTND